MQAGFLHMQMHFRTDGFSVAGSFDQKQSSESFLSHSQQPHIYTSIFLCLFLLSFFHLSQYMWTKKGPKRHIRVLCLNSMTNSLLTAVHIVCVNLDDEVIVLPDMLGGVDTSHIPHKSVLIRTIWLLLYLYHTNFSLNVKSPLSLQQPFPVRQLWPVPLNEDIFGFLGYQEEKNTSFSIWLFFLFRLMHTPIFVFGHIFGGSQLCMQDSGVKLAQVFSWVFIQLFLKCSFA